MLDAEMQIVDLRPTGFFNFDLDKYKDQLVAGYERTLPKFGTPGLYAWSREAARGKGDVSRTTAVASG